MSSQIRRVVRWKTTKSMLCVLNGWVKQIDVKIAKPRNSQSPNFKAFNSIKTLTSSPADLYEPTKSSIKTKPFGDEQRGKFPPLSFASENQSTYAEKPNYFSLSKNNAKTVDNVRPTDRVESFLKRFSHQLSNESAESVTLDSSKKRLSIDTETKISSIFKKNK